MIITEKAAREAAALLEVPLEGLTEAAVTTQYRAKAKAAHPDGGGTTELFAAVDRAKHVLIRWLARAPAPASDVPHGSVTVCPRCGGQGYYMRQHGFKAMRMQCPSCRGSGEVPEREKEGDRL